MGLSYETRTEWGEQQVPMDDRFRGYAQQIGRPRTAGGHAVVLVGWFLVVVALALQRFRDSWVAAVPG